jgi:uncharacterized protein (DUF1778 family)
MIEKQPYANYTLEEEKEESTSETINIRLNATDRARLDELKWFLNESKDGTVLKYALEIAKNVLQTQLSEKSWLKICSQTRKPEAMKRPKSLEKS